VRKYAQAYSSILSKKSFHHFYIDAFAGPGVHIGKFTGEFVPGSPLNARGKFRYRGKSQDRSRTYESIGIAAFDSDHFCVKAIISLSLNCMGFS
jgi:hypothetical protein